MSEQSKPLYEFGPFTIDTTQHLLRREGEAVPLPPKVFDTLVVLAEHSGRVIEKDELMKRIWPDSFVEDVNLAHNISVLRKVLDQGTGQPSYIQTIPKRGYRFTAEVRQVGDEVASLLVQEDYSARVVIKEEEEIADAPPLVLTSIAQKQWFKRWPLQLKLMVGVLVIGLGLAVLLWLRSGKPSEPAAPRIQSIAVLPFKPLAADARDEALELGMADSLITRLSNARRLVVRPISSVRQYQSLEQDPVAAGRHLGVDAVFDGSIQRAGDRIRITARLVRVRDGMPLWGGAFDEEFTDLFAVQDSIAERLTDALALTLTSQEKGLLVKRDTDSPQAYQFYTLGRYFWNKRTAESLTKAIDYFQQAIALDARYALAYAGVADCYIALGARSSSKDASQRARVAAQQALQIDETLAEAHTVLGVINDRYDFDWSAAANEFQRAIELQPNYATAHQWYGIYFEFIGNHEQAIVEFNRALDLDPTSLMINTNLGWGLNTARLADRAIEQFQKTLALDPHFAAAHTGLALAYLEKEMYQQAIEEYKKAMTLSERSSGTVAALGYAYARSGNEKAARQSLQELSAMADQPYRSPYDEAVLLTGLGQREMAFARLRTAYDIRDFKLVEATVDPRLDSLRADPRFAELLRLMRLAP